MWAFLVRKMESLLLETEPQVPHVRCFQGGCDNFENICVALCDIIESRGVDQNDTMPIQHENPRLMNRRYCAVASRGTGPTEEIYELFNRCGPE